MEIEFSIDFESEEIKLLVNNTISLTAAKDSDGVIIYKRFERLESDELQDKLKRVIKILFSIEET